ncbi:MAG: DUF4876 domain-containing protein [Bacteroidetes bacterium]|uniref:DUF4876 domain-containing protein n=1 Tax=Candidatus Cryptobacteroides intestinigallinarum TaxID=2840767 RepID=A0A9D9N114_9BACT|nr:DUF4876 domain-containing protein [Candidatus Cryptobacteroides intestinigallinarum]
MKKFIISALAAVAAATSCVKPAAQEQPVEATINLIYENSPFEQEGIKVRLSGQGGNASWEATTDASGKASFSVLPGLYSASATLSTSEGSDLIVYNGTNPSVAVSAGGNNSFDINMVRSETNQIVIKELYIGGCPKDDGSGYYQYDKYVILYNNSAEEAVLGTDFCFGMCSPANSNATNKYYTGETLSYTDWIPAYCSVWWFQEPVTIQPYSQVVVAMNGAIDHTTTYSQSVDLSNPEYYVMYAPEIYTNVNYHPAPADAIPSSHYLQTYKYNAYGNAWVLSNNSPAFFVFSTEGTTPSAFSQDPGVLQQVNSAATDAMVPVSWVVDGIEVFRATYDADNRKRLLPAVDAGHVTFTAQLGYTLYRNVDKEATEALPENEGLLVYGYTGGTESEADGSTDPSGIDAEASAANGAHIIYKDTNNSSDDFHQRKKASLRK